MSIKLPQQNIWKQNNLSDLYGDIWSSWNLDLTKNKGKISTTRTINVVSQSGTNPTDCGIAVAFRYYNSQHIAITGNDGGTGIAFVSGTERTSFAQQSVAGDPTTISSRYSDAEVFNDILYVSLAGTNLSKNNAGTWTTVAITGAVSGVPHMLCSYANRLYCTTDYAKINSMNTSESWGATIGTSANTLNLGDPTINTITFMRATSSRIWIGTLNRLGGNAHIYAWDGEQTSVSETYVLQSSGAMSAVVKDDVLYVVDNDGRLLTFNGGTFVEIDRFPIKQGEYLHDALLEYNARWIHPNGMTVQDNRILILISNRYRSANLTQEENCPAGVWEWSEDTGLYHKYGLSYKTATGTAQDSGQNRISIPGAIYAFKSFSTSASDNGSILIGAQLYTDGTSTQNYILIDDLNDTLQKYSYFVTPKIFSSEINEAWQKLVLRLKKLTSGDEIVIKYRTEDTAPLDITITTWSSSSSVRTSATDDISDYAAGDEIEFLQGQGSGRCFHISSITDLGGGVNEIVMDGSFVGVSGDDGKARLQKWKKLGTAFTSTTEEKIQKTIIAKNSSWIQFKVSILNTGNSYLYDLLIGSKINEKIDG